MTRPVLSALLCSTALVWMVEAGPVVLGVDVHVLSRRRSQDRPKLHAEPRQWIGQPWFFRGTTTTATTTLTISSPGQTDPPSASPASSTNAREPSTTSHPPAGFSETILSSTSVFTEPSSPRPGDTQLPGGVLSTDTMTTVVSTSEGPAATSDISQTSDSPSDGDSSIGSNRTLVISLSTVLSAVGLVLIAGAVLLCWRSRRGRLAFLSRGVSPIDDDEIERWKSPRDEKAGFPAGDTDVEAEGAFNKETGAPSHAKHPSASSLKKPPSVIVYSSPRTTHNGGSQGPRHSTDAESRRSFAQNHPAYAHGGKSSFDKALPQTPIQARAPNARAGLTDESVPGDEPFLPSPKRTPSRLSKFPSASSRRVQHARARSSRSSTRSFGDYHLSHYYHYRSSSGNGGRSGADSGSEVELSSPRHSHERQHVRRSRSSSYSRNYAVPGGGGGGGVGGAGGVQRGSHSRVYSSSSIPPRLSFGDDGLFGGLSPARPRFVSGGEGEIGRAIG